MNRERLTILADHLDVRQKEIDGGNSERDFDMRDWIVKRWDGVSCRTACCALGEATFIPEFNAAGLIVDYGTEISFNGEDSPLDIAMKFFELTYLQASRIFMPNYYRVCDSELNSKPILSKEVSARIRAVIKEEIENADA